MKALILGAAGQVGSEVSEALLQTIDHRSADELVIIEKTRDMLDVTDFGAVETAFSKLKPNWVINAAAYTKVDGAESEPKSADLLNELVPKRLAKMCEDYGAKLIHISTDYVFPGHGDEPFDESCDVSPLGIYGASKLGGERGIREELGAHIILRTSWVFGQYGDNFVKTMLRLASSRDEISVVCDQIGAPTSARSIARAIASIMMAMEKAVATDHRWGTYHYSGYPFCSWSGFAKEIFAQAAELKLINASPQVISISTEEYPTPAVRPRNSRLDCGKIQAVFDIEPDDWPRSLRTVLSRLKSVEDK